MYNIKFYTTQQQLATRNNFSVFIVVVVAVVHFQRFLNLL